MKLSADDLTEIPGVGECIAHDPELLKWWNWKPEKPSKKLIDTYKYPVVITAGQ